MRRIRGRRIIIRMGMVRGVMGVVRRVWGISIGVGRRRLRIRIIKDKTATYAVGTLAKLDPTINRCQSLILAPTRELANQIEKVVIALRDYINIKVHACAGGTAAGDNICILSARVHIVAGTPGRVGDMINRRALCLDNIQQLFLDEADEMFSRGFRDEIYNIFKYLPETVQVCLFSATILLEVMELHA